MGNGEKQVSAVTPLDAPLDCLTCGIFYTATDVCRRCGGYLRQKKKSEIRKGRPFSSPVKYDALSRVICFLDAPLPSGATLAALIVDRRRFSSPLDRILEIEGVRQVTERVMAEKGLSRADAVNLIKGIL